MLTRSTIGKLLIEEALPEEMRGRNLTFDKKTVQSVLREVAQNHPDKYVEVSKKLADIGRQVATETGGYSFGLEALRQPESAKKTIGEIKQKVKELLVAPNLTDKQRQEAIIRTVGGYQQGLMQDIYKESLAAKNPIAMQIMSGSRGNVMNLASLLGSDLLYEDHRGDIIPLPVLHSYSQGLSPAEYWAGTYGARKGVIATKFATADAGFFGKQLNQVAHRLAVVDQDDPRQDMGIRGFPVDTDDMDNEGALLAQDFGGYKKNTVLTPKILKDLKGRGFDRLLVRSPLTGGSPDGGVYARDVGVRERGVLPGRGEMVGMTAAQALAEPVSQGQLSAKHSGGVAGQEKTVGGFQYIDQLIQVPKTFKGGAAHTTVDGKVQKIEDAPAGGKYVFINDKPQYVGQGFDIKVKPGDEVEAGDVLSEGIPNPSIITQYKGIGEGRRYFTKTFRDAMGSMGLRSHRRNIELIGRGLIDHVRLTEEYGDHVPDDVIPYSTLEHTYKPREGAMTTTPDRALNKYLEKPVLHYTIGTQIRPSMMKDFKYFGINDVTVHDKPAPFEPEMVRAMYNLHHDPDWMTRMYGSGLKGSLLEATHRGSTSTATGTSFVPGLSKGTEFGRVGVVQQPKMGLKPELNTPAPATPANPTDKQASDDLYFVKCAETDPSKVILISGHSGAGKSTAAKQLSDALGLPVMSIDDHPALKQIFKNDPENKHMTPGSIERRRYLAAARRMALDTINSAKDGAIVEGTQLAALRKQQLEQYPHRVLVTTPLKELLQQRLDRTKQRVEAKGNPWTPEVEAYRSELGQKLYDSNKSDMNRFGNTPGTLTYDTRADNVDSLLDTFKDRYKYADDILPGGIGDKYNVSDFNTKEMKKGIKTEMEHTISPEIAADISKDHLTEDPDYYTKLQKQEKKSTYSVAAGIAKTRNKKADDASVKPETGSSTAKPTATTGAPPAPKAPATAPNAAITPPQTTPTGTPVNTPVTGAAPKPYTMEHSFGNKKVTLNSNMTTQDIYRQLQENNFNSALGSAKQKELNRQKSDALYRQMQLQNATGSPNATGTFQQGQLTSASATSPVQTPNPVTPQQTQPVQPQPKNQITPKNTLPAPAQATAAPASTVAPSTAQNSNFLSAAANPYDPIGNFGENIKNTLQTFGQAAEDIGTLTGFNRISPYASFTYDYMDAGDKARKTGPEVYDAATEVKQRQDNVKKMLQQQQNQQAVVAPILEQSNKTFTETPQAGYNALVDLGGNVGTLAAGGLPNAISKGMTATTTLGGFGRGALQLGKNILGGTPGLNLLASTVGELAANRDAQDILASADAWQDRYKSMQDNFKKRQYLAALKDTGILGTSAFFNPYGSAQDFLYSNAHLVGGPLRASRYSAEGQQERRNAAAETLRGTSAFFSDIPGFRTNEQAPEELQDKRNWWQKSMPTYLGGTYGPSIASQQTPEVQSIMAKRTQWAANSVERNQQLINALEPEELKQYRSALNPTQQAQFDQLIQFRLQDEQKKQDPQYLRSIDTSAITPSRAALMRQRGNVSSSQ